MTDLTWFKSSHSGSEGGNCLEVAYQWRKSSYSSEEGGNCVEVAYPWHKSSHSSEEGGACVEVAAHPSTVHVRDSKDPEGPHLDFSPGAWASFTSYAAGTAAATAAP
ncbi:DUF397 domain-containing protein [Streptomyces sp. NPDC020742]|uniref:DUF397 domain-containing protein n=1 Tax=Streptomyces sp. NPDC020742 TaxID=3154897 RepID=UPI0033F80965